MTVVINGTTGITSVNGTAGAPSMTGTDTDTGIVYGTNTMSLATGGTAAVTIDSSQNVTFAGSINTTNFSIVQSGTKLYIKYGATNIMSIDSSGNIIALANITAYGTP